MKKTICFLSFILLIHFCAYAQNKNDLVGTWYGKIRAYAFKQDGNAQCYTKRRIAGSQQQLIIDEQFNYVYTEYYRGDTIKTRGYVDLNKDTLRFLMPGTNQTRSYVSESDYSLYVLNNSELIYSNFPVRKIVKEDNEDKIFTPVEVRAEYNLGKDKFMKTLYTSLTSVGISKDSVKINSYQVKIDSLGNMDVTTLRAATSADPEYFNAIKQGLLNLRDNFKPALQNGKAVNAYMSFLVTY